MRITEYFENNEKKLEMDVRAVATQSSKSP